MFIQIKNAIVSVVILTVLTGIAYPLAVTGVTMALFNHKANGSLMDGNTGSLLIGQNFDAPKYFWGRLSATSPMSYNAASSSGSNYAMTNPALIDAANGRIAALKAADPTNTTPIPVDLVTASGSGLDPHISLAAAEFQVNRVAQARGIAPDKIMATVHAHAEMPDFGLLGEPRVNVLVLNLLLDGKLPDEPAVTTEMDLHTVRGRGFMYR